MLTPTSTADISPAKNKVAARLSATANATRTARVDLLRTHCIVCIVFLHFPMLNAAMRDQQLGIARMALDMRDEISNGLLYTALPTLAFISGYVAWRPGVEVDYFGLLLKKFRTLLVPMLIWNGIVLVASFAAQSHGYLSDVRMRLADVNVRMIIESLTSLTRNPVNYPLHFLRDLFVLFALWPIWAWFIRRAPFIGLALVTVVFIGNLEGNLVRRDTMAVTFYVGLLFGSGTFAIKSLDRYRGAAICGLALLAAAQSWLASHEQGEPLQAAAIVAIRLTAPFLIWSAAGLLEKTLLGRVLASATALSFPVFLMHAPMLQVEYRLLPTSVATNGTAHVLAWLAASAATIAICIVTCVAARRLWPRTAAIAFGGRM